MSGNIKLNTPSNGSVTISTPDTASSVTVTIPAATDTVTLNTQAQTLTNKTLTAAGSNTVEATSGPTSSQLAGNRNKIINGAMMIDQRNAGASVAAASGYTLDRFFTFFSNSGTASIQRSATAPNGFINSLLYTVTSADSSVAAGDYAEIEQRIEGFNVSDFGFGGASASTITLTFWVRSSVTGTYCVNFRNNANNRSYIKEYTINAANTWEQKTVTITGDTTGTWTTDNSSGLIVGFALMVGSTFQQAANSWGATSYGFGSANQTNLMATNGATFYITGVQLEKGSSATPFENRLYGTELALCQRYYTTVGGDSVNQVITMLQAYSSTQTNGGTVPFPVKMRTAPTFTYSALSDIYVQVATSAVITPTALSTGAAEGSTMCGVIRATVASGLTAGNAVSLLTANTNARLNFSAEL